MTAKLTVHNVGHGQCISLVHDNGNVMLWDCGHEGDNRPSAFLPQSGNQKIDYFFITNYDEDHISDLDLLRKTCVIRSIVKNGSITPDQLYALKRESGPLSEGMESLIDMLREYTFGPLDPAPDFPGVYYATFYNEYDKDFSDTNNISLVTYLSCRGTNFLITGDVEKKGWLSLLKDPAFRTKLSTVNVFFAGHHGRENGYCEEVFQHCKPDVFVFSDSSIEFTTQETANKYGKHAHGIRFNGQNRSVLTTRNDNTFSWNL